MAMKRYLFIFAILAGAATALFWRPSRSRQNNYNTVPKKLSDVSRHILDTSEQFFLLSLEPLYPNQPITQTREKFHDYPVLGRLEIKDPKQKGELLRSLYKGISDSDGNVPACYNPRHGIRAVSGTNWIDLVICFQCKYMQEYGTGSSAGANTTKSPAETFNRILKQAEVPITTR
jgi:hypothetical protein